MTCTISGLDANNAVAVTWKEPDGATVSDDVNYDLLAGTVTQIDGSGVQNAVLTIKAAKLADAFAGDDATGTKQPTLLVSVIWSCAMNIQKLLLIHGNGSFWSFHVGLLSLLYTFGLLP